MFEIILENEIGNQLHFGAGYPYTITEFSGLNPPDATINTNQAALLDGGFFNSSKLQMRNINLAFAIEAPAEENRLNVYKVIQSKQKIKLYFKSEQLDIWIEGYVESLDFSYFAMKNIATVNILCPAPYFKGAQEIINELHTLIPMFHFPTEGDIIFGRIDPQVSVEVENEGSVETGLTFELYAKNTVSGPKIFNYQTNEFMGIDIDMEMGDLITITTGQGNKTITLLRNAVETNIFNYLSKDSTWLQLTPGGTVFVYEVAEGSTTNLDITIKHYDQYEGV